METYETNKKLKSIEKRGKKIDIALNVLIAFQLFALGFQLCSLIVTFATL